MIRATVNTSAARAHIEAIKAGLTPENIDPIVHTVALKTLADVVQKTPKRWFGQVRAAWHIEKPGVGVRTVVNSNKVMKFLEEGTANAGTGWIYPKVKKFLYIPLVRAAAAGWHEGLRRGVDYILRRRVRGIKPIAIIPGAKARSQAALKEEFKRFIRKLIDTKPTGAPTAGPTSRPSPVAQTPDF